MKEKKEPLLLPACSCMTLTSKEGCHYWFRTCDIEKEFWQKGAHIVCHGAGSSIAYGDGKIENNLYTFQGITYNFLDTWLLDGVNEWGLCGGLLMLEEGTSVEKVTEDKEGYIGMEVVTKMLSSCQNVKNTGEEKEKNRALSLYGYQLIVNFLWPVFFFDFQWYFFAFLWLVLLWVLVAKMIFQFGNISQTAALLNAPYLLWLGFAGYLNLGIWLLN